MPVVHIFKSWGYFLRISTYEHNIYTTPTSFSIFQFLHPSPKCIYSLVIIAQALTCAYVCVLYRYKCICNLLSPSVFALMFTYLGLNTLDDPCESVSLSTMDSSHHPLTSWSPSSMSGSIWNVPCMNWYVRQLVLFFLSYPRKYIVGNWWVYFSCLTCLQNIVYQQVF